MALYEKIKEWAERNAASLDLYNIDFNAEIDQQLSFDENVQLLIKRHPELAPHEDFDHPKQLVMWAPLIPIIKQGRKMCTYRPKALHGTYYLVENRFRTERDAKGFIEIISVDKISPWDLTPEEAKWSGVKSKAELLRLFKKWYGDVSRVKYRNWFRVLDDEIFGGA